MQWAEFAQRLEQLSSFLIWRNDGSRMLNHASFREWLVWREEEQDDRFLCDPRYANTKERAARKEEQREKLMLSCVSVCLQEWPHSTGLLALQARGEAEPTADTGAGTSHPESSHL